MNNSFWKDKKVLVTGHTGFKGAWLVLMLKNAGARVAGYSVDVPTKPSMYEVCEISKELEFEAFENICDREKLHKCFSDFHPEIVFHLAAQSLVRDSYSDPFTTYQTNVMGTLNVLMEANNCDSVNVIINVTTDKCYKNNEWIWGYREIDALGGHDPYSSSKACAEILSESIRKSFLEKSGKTMATVRAGNVIGGGDWAKDRIIPDMIRALQEGKKLEIRNPSAVRPWQHVIEPLTGYLTLAEKCHSDKSFGEAWNFGPNDEDCKSVDYLVTVFASLLEGHKGYAAGHESHKVHEANLLKLDCSKAKSILGWTPKLRLEKALSLTADWYIHFIQNKNVKQKTLDQIREYQR